MADLVWRRKPLVARCSLLEDVRIDSVVGHGTAIITKEWWH
jgi:hypothetical protein